MSDSKLLSTHWPCDRRWPTPATTSDWHLRLLGSLTTRWPALRVPCVTIPTISGLSPTSAMRTRTKGKRRMPSPPTKTRAVALVRTRRSTATCCWRCNTRAGAIPRPSCARREPTADTHARPGSRHRQASTSRQLCGAPPASRLCVHLTSARHPVVVFSRPDP